MDFSMDPLDITFVDVYDLILQHFKAKDAIQSSLVSNFWYQIIGSSRHCMKHVWLRVDNPTEQLETLKRSQRRYENFRIQPGLRAELAKVLKKFRPKIAMITDDDEVKFDDHYSFMRSLAPTVEQLHPGEASIINAFKLKTLDFPKLKELQYTLTDHYAFSIFLGSNPKLEKVLLSFSNEMPSDFLIPTNLIHQFFQRNPQIKSLWICEIDYAFLYDVTQNVHLDLKTFAFGKTGCNFSEKVRVNLVKFIKHQKNLEWLKILCLHDLEVFLRIWNQTKFRKLFIMDCNLKGALQNLELKTNYNLDEINFYLNPSCRILKFLRATPNLATFRVRQLSPEIMDFCARQMPRLQSIQFQSIETNVKSLYDELKASNTEDINKKIELKEMDFFEFVGRDAGF